MRYFIKLSYDGSSFCGWQFQPNAPSVQECLEKALSTLLKAEVAVVGAGRTDSTVNAVGYVAHFDFNGPVPQPLAALDGDLDAEKLGYKLNAILPRGIVVHDVSSVSQDLHARFSASRREYTYFLHRTKDPFVEAYSYFCPCELDVDAMNKAAALLLGKHDFRCFEKVGSDNRTSECEVFEARWVRYEPVHVSVMGFRPADSHLYFRISADRFLRNMVRAVVGSLLEVGRGRRSVEDFAALVLPAGNVPEGDGAHVRKDGTPFRSMAGESVPGHALFLSKVEY